MSHRILSLCRGLAPAIATIGLVAWTGAALLAPTAPCQSLVKVNPANTGLPGDEVRLVRIAPDGKVWVAARWIFWGYGGIGWYDPGHELWTAWSTNDGGFPSAFVNDIDYAPDGAAWIATSHGLVRWKAGVLQRWTQGNSPLLHNVVADVSVAPDGAVWLNNTDVNSTNAAIFCFANGVWTQFAVGGALPWAPPWKQLSDVLVDHAGHVWVTNQVLNGVAEYDGSSWTLHGAGVDRFGEVAEDAAGNIWLISGIGGFDNFWRFDHATFKAFPAGTTPTAIGIGADGSVYLGDWNGTVRRSQDFGATMPVWVTGLNHVFQIAPDPARHEVWIGTQGALGRFDAGGTWLEDFNGSNTGSGDYFIDRYALDRTGGFWLASGETGLSRFDGLQWRNWGAHNQDSEPYPFAGNEPMGTAYIDAQGQGWMGGNGIARWDPDSGEFDGFWNWSNNPPMSVTLFTHFAEDAQGRLFAAAENGDIFRFGGAQWSKEPITPYSGGHLPGMEADGQGRVWVAGWLDAWSWDGTAWTQLVTPYPDYFFDLEGINDLATGPGGVVWFATQEGLVRLDDGQFTLFTTANSGLPTNAVQAVDVRPDGVLGLACSKFGPVTPFPHGACIVDGDPGDPASWTVWTYGSSPLPHYQLEAAEFDGAGNLWVSAMSEGSAVVLNPAQPLAVDRPTLSASVGGKIGLALDAGPANAGRVYVLFTSMSGASPGVTFPGGLVLPLNWDLLSSIAFSAINSPVFAGFLGTLDGAGRAQATLNMQLPMPVAIGLELHFAYALAAPWNFASNPVPVRFTP